MSCSRLTRDHRSCRRDAADWPPYDGMPDPVAACWGHLTNTEREQCQAARRRRSQESRQHYERLRAEREARGELDPKPVVREARPCIGQCITCADQWDRENPDRFYDHSDSAMIACAHCDETVCILCRDRNHALGTSCTSPSTVDDDLQPLESEHVDHGPNPREYLNGLVDRLARVTGERHAAVNREVAADVGRADRMSAFAGRTVERRWPWSDLPNEPDGTEVRATVVSSGLGIASQLYPHKAHEM